jgi:mitochondrial fission protein ELM1
MSDAAPRIWVLLGERQGDNNQVLALAEALGRPFETRSLRYNVLRALKGTQLGQSLISVRPSCRRWLAPPWPDLIIAIGRRSVPPARWIKRQNGGRTMLVRVGHPRIDPRLFDLVITTHQYPVPPEGNVILLPLAMSRYGARPKPEQEELDWLSSLPRPHLLMAIGGPTKYWKLETESLAETALKLVRRARDAGGSLVAIGSPRTDPAALETVRHALAGQPHCHLLTDNRVRFPVLLDDADEHFVTADSVSMLSEAILTGKPVGLIPIQLSPEGTRKLEQASIDSPRRDLRRFWRHLQDEGLIGTIDEPKSGKVADPVQTAADAVRRLLGDVVE